MNVDVTVLYFEGCPSWQTAIERVLDAAAATGVQVHVSAQAVESEQDAQQFEFIGSPTILLDGTDPFAQPGDVAGLVCRVYTTPDDLAGSPTVDQLADALTRMSQ